MPSAKRRLSRLSVSGLSVPFSSHPDRRQQPHHAVASSVRPSRTTPPSTGKGRPMPIGPTPVIFHGVDERDMAREMDTGARGRVFESDESQFKEGMWAGDGWIGPREVHWLGEEYFGCTWAFSTRTSRTVLGKPFYQWYGGLGPARLPRGYSCQGELVSVRPSEMSASSSGILALKGQSINRARLVELPVSYRTTRTRSAIEYIDVDR